MSAGPTAATRDEWSIHQLAKLAGTTSRTLRHYDDLGLLPPSRIGANGYRHYDQGSVVRLQRILMLRDLGLGLPAIAEVLARQVDEVEALRAHKVWLHAEMDRLARQLHALDTTIGKLEGGEQIMAEEALEGFDHTQYADEVEQRWGKEAYERSDRWWRSLGELDKQRFQQTQLEIAKAFGEAKSAGLASDDERVQSITQRLFDWLAGIPGTPGAGSGGPTKEYFTGLGEMYVADQRFRQNYDVHAEGTAELIRDAMRVYADRHL
jgi:DNA-binding transcriptional MerR regulator